MPSNFVSDISKISVLLPTTSVSISNLFLIELILKWVIMIRFKFFLCITCNASSFSVSSELVTFRWFMADLSDFSVYPKLPQYQNLNPYENYRLPVKIKMRTSKFNSENRFWWQTEKFQSKSSLKQNKTFTCWKLIEKATNIWFNLF